MLKKVLIGLVVVVLALVAFISSRPDDFKIERSAEIAAPADVVFAQVNDLHKWNAWSPWEKMDPTMKKTYEGPEAGVGSKYSWQGNSKVGEGAMTILESVPSSKVLIKLEFLKPFQATNETILTINSASPTQSTIHWSMTGKSSFPAKAAGLFMNMDKMVGADFETGLANLKKIAEENAKAAQANAAPAEAPAAAAEVPAPTPTH
jgi:hypothetical protein